MDHTASIVPSYPEAFPPLDTCTPITTQHNDIASPICAISSPTTTTTTPTTLDPLFQIHYETPLYTEINIPLPRLPPPRNPARTTKPSSPTSPTPTSPTTAQAPPRGRSKTLSSLSLFRTRRSSSTSSSSSQQPLSPSTSRPSTSSLASVSETQQQQQRPRKETVKSREVNALMDLRHQSKKGRSGTIDALAVVPAVLVLSAELFTPGEKGGRRKDSGVGRWEDGIR
ncbi:hypothetical protein COCMIDRAFT_6954 [Bipolaris oryzae ATCC 44560]|uniref:Uncharacterized protein n=1 Tax=Bipolaris oryzae ATCC 44560 TaxID=930090 RepID=W6ZJ63_COCMI|nr:uncharacterized protein COCMIDRAFT_6954 [Bipolaris oryzae ATCC 44560]EUC43646.1 hypothetical protein COCMIDRAFT_6954 [Bipolaris oryzae ATCC 44560]